MAMQWQTANDLQWLISSRLPGGRVNEFIKKDDDEEPHLKVLCGRGVVLHSPEEVFDYLENARAVKKVNL